MDKRQVSALTLLTTGMITCLSSVDHLSNPELWHDHFHCPDDLERVDGRDGQ